jgi:hypothetical protein
MSKVNVGDVVAINLVNGSEVMGTVKSITRTTLTLENPVRVNMQMTGEQSLLGLLRYSLLTSSTETEFRKSTIIAAHPASEVSTKFYHLSVSYLEMVVDRTTTEDFEDYIGSLNKAIEKLGHKDKEESKQKIEYGEGAFPCLIRNETIQ